MARKSRIRLVGKRAAFDVERWARALERLAHQLHEEGKGTEEGHADVAQPERPEDGRPC